MTSTQDTPKAKAIRKVGSQFVRVLGADDVIGDKIFEVDDGPDHKGNFVLLSPSTTNNQKRQKVHVSRLLPVQSPSAEIVRHNGTILYISCPQCQHDTPVEVGMRRVTCQCHRSCSLNWETVPVLVRPAPQTDYKPVQAAKAVTRRPATAKTPQIAKQINNIDFDFLKKHCELWTKGGINFDHGGFDVKAHIIVIYGEAEHRKLSFNSYNGTWGKKAKDKDVKLFIDETKTNNKHQWYYFASSRDELHAKLKKNGYILDK